MQFDYSWHQRVGESIHLGLLRGDELIQFAF